MSEIVDPDHESRNDGVCRVIRRDRDAGGAVGVESTKLMQRCIECNNPAASNGHHTTVVARCDGWRNGYPGEIPGMQHSVPQRSRFVARRRCDDLIHTTADLDVGRATGRRENPRSGAYLDLMHGGLQLHAGCPHEPRDHKTYEGARSGQLRHLLLIPKAGQPGMLVLWDPDREKQAPFFVNNLYGEADA